MDTIADPEEAFWRAVKQAKIQKPTRSLTRQQILNLRRSILNSIIEAEPYIENYGLIPTEGLTLDAIWERVLYHGRPLILPIIPRKTEMTRKVAIPTAIQGIYRDIDMYARNPTVREQAMEVVWSLLLKTKTEIPMWYDDALKYLGRSLLGYLIRSRSFLHAAVEMSATNFKILLDILVENKASLMVFARVRLPRIAELDADGNEVEDEFRGVRIKKDPHCFVVPATGSLVTRTFAKTIDDNIFDASNFQDVDAPRDWPVELEWPSHPGARRFDTKCYMCTSWDICSCRPPLPTDGQILVEVHNYGPIGRGIRALHNIKRGTILGEYVGTFKHNDADMDTTYAMHFDNKLQIERGKPIALIDASAVGNWTRFINHTCDEANVQFSARDIGKYKRIVVEAVRDINLYEQLFVDYGEDYWVDCRICHCGKQNCCNPPPSTTNAIAAHTKTNKKRSWISEEAHHADSSDDENYRPKKRVKASKMTAAQRTAKAKRTMEARARLEQKSKDEEEAKTWEKRWIGRDDIDLPREETGIGFLERYAEF